MSATHSVPVPRFLNQCSRDMGRKSPLQEGPYLDLSLMSSPVFIARLGVEGIMGLLPGHATWTPLVTKMFWLRKIRFVFWSCPRYFRHRNQGSERDRTSQLGVGLELSSPG